VSPTAELSLNRQNPIFRKECEETTLSQAERGTSYCLETQAADQSIWFQLKKRLGSLIQTAICAHVHRADSGLVYGEFVSARTPASIADENADCAPRLHQN
jgi:hypothetical protein